MEMMNDEDIADWSDLPFDLLSEITDKVTSSSLEDRIRFGCICVQWRSFLLLEKNYEQIKLSSLPVLLIPSLNHHHHPNYDNNRVEMADDVDSMIMYNYYNPREVWLGLDPKQRHTSTRSFYSLSEKKVYDFQLQVPSNLHCRGSSHGWLLLVEECLDGTYPVHLFNPFRSSDKKNKIQLPPLTSPHPNFSPVNRSSFLKKVVFGTTDPLSSSSSSLLVSNPTTTNFDDDDDFVVLGLYDNAMLWFCRPGDRAWTPLQIPNHRQFFDVICYRGQFWGILQNGTALAFDITPEPKVTLVVDPHPEDSCSPVVRYLVESAGDLFNVRREHCFPRDIDYSTVGFHLFKLDQTSMEWVKTNTLDGRVFFLGDNASISLSPPSDYFPESCKPNSIYFTDDYEEYYQFTPWDAPHDIGVFNVEDGTLEPHYKMESKTIMPAPIWIKPTL